MALIDLIRSNENTRLFLSLLQRGVIPISLMDRKVYYEFYIEQIKELKDSGGLYRDLAVRKTMDEFNIKSKNTVYNAINLMES